MHKPHLIKGYRDAWNRLQDTVAVRDSVVATLLENSTPSPALTTVKHAMHNLIETRYEELGFCANKLIGVGIAITPDASQGIYENYTHAVGDIQHYSRIYAWLSDNFNKIPVTDNGYPIAPYARQGVIRKITITYRDLGSALYTLHHAGVVHPALYD